MANTHDWKLKVGSYTFKSECEITDAGVLAYTEDSDEKNAPTNRPGG